MKSVWIPQRADLAERRWRAPSPHRMPSRALRGAAAIVAAVLLEGPTARAQCHTFCLPGEEPDAQGCCAPRGSPASGAGPAATSGVSAQVIPADGVGAACRPGQNRVVGTNYCCWPGQVWATNACRGLPSSCPDGFHVDEPREDCALNECQPGRARMLDGVHCCWPGQVWAEATCRGRPTSCPVHYEVVGESCSDRAFQESEARRRANDESQRQLAEREAAQRLEDQRRAEQQREDAARYAQRERDENYRFNGEVGYGLIGGFGVRDKRSTHSDRAGGLLQAMAINLRFLIPLTWTAERRPGFALEFGLGGAMVYAFSGSESVLNLLGSLDAGVRLGPVVASASAQIDSFDLASGTTVLQYGVGLGAGSLGRPNDLSWRIDLRWFPGATGLSSNFNVVRNEFLVRASMGFGLFSFGVFGRYFDQLGPLLDGFGGGLFLGTNFRS